MCTRPNFTKAAVEHLAYTMHITYMAYPQKESLNAYDPASPDTQQIAFSIMHAQQRLFTNTIILGGFGWFQITDVSMSDCAIYTLY